MVSQSARPPDLGAWPSLEILQPLGGGARAEVWAACRGDQKMVVKVSTRSPESLAWELELTRHLHREGISVPAPVLTAEGCQHDGGVWVAPFLTGQAPRSRRDWQGAAEAITAVRDLTRGWPQRPGSAGARELTTASSGADVDLAAMPAEAAALVRAAWTALLEWKDAGARGPASCVVHGDLGPRAVLIHGEQVSIIDWDEARVDTEAFDLAGLPRDVRPGGLHLGLEATVAEVAALAWETATCWVVEPDYAQRRLVELRQRSRHT